MVSNYPEAIRNLNDMIQQRKNLKKECNSLLLSDHRARIDFEINRLMAIKNEMNFILKECGNRK